MSLRWDEGDYLAYITRQQNTDATTRFIKSIGKTDRVSKYRNKKVTVDGITFDSKREFARWNQLKMLEQLGEITELKRQVPFELVPSVELDGKKQRPVMYIADFTYKVHNGYYLTVEDSKGFKTDEYRIKRKLMKHIHGIEIEES